MSVTYVFFIGSAILCLVLAAFATPLFRWSNELTRRLGFHKLADFRERVWPVLGPIARIVLVLTAILILVLTLQLANKSENGTANNYLEDIGANRAESSR